MDKWYRFFIGLGTVAGGLLLAGAYWFSRSFWITGIAAILVMLGEFGCFAHSDRKHEIETKKKENPPCPK